jgi:cell division protein FtsQ
VRLRRRKRPRRRTIRLMPLFTSLRRWVLRLTWISGLLLLSVWVYRALDSSSFLALKTIDVRSAGALDRREILDWAGLHPGGSLLMINLGELRWKLESHPWVARARVKRVFPHTLEIHIEERRPVARVRVDQEAFLLDRTGVLFASLDLLPQEDWTTLVGLSRSDLERRPQATQRVLQAALELLQILRARPSVRVGEIRVDPSRGLSLTLPDQAAEVRLGFGEFDDRIDRLHRILEHLAKEGLVERTEWIDLRYSRRAMVKFKG